MKAYEKALDKFIQPWIKKKEVSAILLCGSYVTGNPTKNSDLDVHIIMENGTDWRERGNKIVDGFLIEYFANPGNQYLEYLQEDFAINRTDCSHMLYTGKVIYSNDDLAVKKLKLDAKKWLNKTFKKAKGFSLESIKYHIWDMNDNLEEASVNHKVNFDYIYYTMLEKLKEDYFEGIGYYKIPNNKVERFLFDRKDQTKYDVRKLEDLLFKKKFKACLDAKSKKSKVEAFDKLTKHCLKKLGGFSIDGWKLKGKI